VTPRGIATGGRVVWPPPGSRSQGAGKQAEKYFLLQEIVNY